MCIRDRGCYADIIAMRHPKEGAPIVASRRTTVPIINGGDGGHHHPTQTLTDLLTITREKGRLNNLTVGLCGDLKFGRTVHSLIEAMLRYENVKFVLIAPPELRVPQYIIDMLEKAGAAYKQVDVYKRQLLIVLTWFGGIVLRSIFSRVGINVVKDVYKRQG